MTTWMTERDFTSPQTPADPRTDALLRAVDITLSGLLMLPAALPCGLAAALGARLQREPRQGRQGHDFEMLSLSLPDSRLGRVAGWLGAARAPVLLNILRGDMAFAGPRPRAPQEPVEAATLAVRPGLANPWFIRQRTAVDFGSEAQADAQYLGQRGLRHDLGLLLRALPVALLPRPLAPLPGRVRVCDVAFDNLNMNEAVARLRDMLDGPTAQQVSFVNPACVNIAAGHRGYRRVLARVALVLPDGIGIKIGSDLLGTPLKQNVNGTDLFAPMCDMLQARGASVFLLGGQPGIAERVAAAIGQRWPGLRVAGLRNGFYGPAEEGAVAAQINASGADVLLVARGVPQQDLFIDRYLPLLQVKVAMGVGGLFDFVSGRIARAPQWMRETGLEWVYRLLQEPGRMWRRYLLGNFSFLARVLLQRLGLRQPAADAQPAPRAAATAAGLEGTGVRAVLFATPRAAAGLPVPADYPAALLPLACQTVAEQLMARLAEAAVTDVDIVASDHPERLRAVLGDGSRWGLRLRWHLVKDPARPYGVLRSEGLRAARHLVLGHADLCPDAATLLRLTHAEGWALKTDAEQGVGWTGWAGLAPSRLATLGPDLDRAGFERAISTWSGSDLPRLLCAGDTLASVGSARDLLRAAFTGAAGDAGHAADTGAVRAAEPRIEASELQVGAVLADVPAAWIRRPWGAMSPLARVHPGARLIGPVSVGPGCIVERGASVGPGVVLSRDVVVSADTRIEHTVVLPDSYVGANLELSSAVVNGNRVLQVHSGVELTLGADDALLADWSAPPVQRPAALPRLMAAVVWLLAAPLGGPWAAVRRLRGRAPGWTLRRVVAGRDSGTQALRFATLRCAWPGASDPISAAGAAWAGLLDVAAGRRCWFGMRPRDRSQWYALRPEWQRILSQSPVGLLHAPAWTDDPTNGEEAGAAADVYGAVQPPMRRWRLVLSGLARALWSAPQPSWPGAAPAAGVKAG